MMIVTIVVITIIVNMKRDGLTMADTIREIRTVTDI